MVIYSLTIKALLLMIDINVEVVDMNTKAYCLSEY